MIFRRVAEVLRLRGAIRLMDERAAHRRRLDELAVEQQVQTEAVRDIASQAKLGSYRRVRLGR